MSANQPQPAPIPNAERPTWEIVVEDMKERDQTGREKYGVHLQPCNGRKSIVDAYQESLDHTVYLKNEIIERDRMEARIRHLEQELKDTQDLLQTPEYAREQPCGCIVCVCETNDRCHGCGAKMCEDKSRCVFTGDNRKLIQYADAPTYNQLRAELASLKNQSHTN